ncbi:MAG: exodeoxyribonuclease V subunit alpha [Deltaproteobacteria bacterium]|nr:exodeoxyribonuclease V subunit alpha [Deltaproteobacteria bacterium]MBW2658304.1 exodeoxyribonuclease V subunit alpha [Deltaproteobacteria bacterium]
MVSETDFSLFDSHFAGFLAARSGLSSGDKEQFFDLIAALSRSMSAGHSCHPLSADECALLKKTTLVSNGSNTPLVIYNSHLYLHRYFLYESRLARQIKRLAAVSYEPNVESGELLDLYFDSSSAMVDWQKRSAAVALEKGLTIISGGPGTGKTTTVAKIIILLLQAIDSSLRIGLAAPTGKAAMRLQLSVGSSFETISLPEEIRSALPGEAKTLHRLLGARRNSPRFNHNGDNPMSWDVVIVDEASMIDLALMSKLVDALKPGSRLILVGDKDQLSSVESGSVLADCIKSLPENTVTLRETFRFDRGIQRLAAAVNAGDFDRTYALLEGETTPNVTLMDDRFSRYAGERYKTYMEKVSMVHNLGIKAVFAALADFQVLSSVHRGERGVEGINRNIEFYLAEKGIACRPGGWYEGRPVLVTRNEYSLGLFNGDIGICISDPRDHRLKVWFEKEDGGFHTFLPYRLPECETAFAITVHKSQGSEFNEVLVVLPTEDNRVLCRELLYTAVTRARKQVGIVVEESVLAIGLSRRMQRFSGLAGQI